MTNNIDKESFSGEHTHQQTEAMDSTMAILSSIRVDFKAAILSYLAFFSLVIAGELVESYYAKYFKKGKTGNSEVKEGISVASENQDLDKTEAPDINSTIDSSNVCESACCLDESEPMAQGK
jgi:hypothetical protein